MPRNRTRRIARFLTAEQTKHFLEAGLRWDGAPLDSRPASPERDYCYALVLATTGLRRAEGALLLDCEIPEAHRMSGEGVYAFTRTGKLGVTRTVYATRDMAHALDLYRRAERGRWIERAQPRLRTMRREGRLFLVESVTAARGRAYLSVEGHRIPAERLTDEQRAVAAYVTDDGHIEPLALFVSARGGLAPRHEYWNELFAAARDRVAALDDPCRPPDHITVSPHTMRHTFAVRMLHALMREGQERAGNPYYLLANPVMTVKDLLGHASMNTVHDYLFAAETWTQEVPLALRQSAAALVGHTSPEPDQPGQAQQ
jgi:integrase